MKTSERLSNVWSKRHLPEELWPEILSRLPVKSLLRFRCVSKGWLSLINNPDFGRLHLENFKNNQDETHLLVIQHHSRKCALHSSNTFETSTELFDLFGWKIVCSVHGLILLTRFVMPEFSGLYKLSVWNPSLRKVHGIPSLDSLLGGASTFWISAFRSYKGEEIGLGFDPLAKDYKLVKLIFKKGDILPLIAVYTLGARSWRIIPFQGKGCSNWQWNQPWSQGGQRWSCETHMKVYLRDSLYFKDFNVERKIMELVSIDLSSEVFSCTSLPYAGYQGLLTLVDDGCTLALLDFDYGAMWVLNSSAESESSCWSQRYSFSLDVPEFLYLKKNGDILIYWEDHEMSFTLATDEELVEEWNMLSLYNLETKRQKILLQTKDPSFCVHNVCGYVESLIMLQTDGCAEQEVLEHIYERTNA